MKSRYSIGIFIAALILIAGIVFIYEISFKHAEQEYLSARTAGQEQHETVEAEGTAKKEDGYYLTEEDGFVVIYLADKKTVYEHTSIKTLNLPEKLQKELQSFKKIPDLKSLYGFLENYSS